MAENSPIRLNIAARDGPTSPSGGGRPMQPRARTEGMLTEVFPDQTLVCDVERNVVHSLRPLAAMVWGRCDGETSAGQLAAAARGAGFDADEELIALALDRLADAGLVT